MKQKLIDLGVWEKFDANYTNPENGRDDESAEEYLLNRSDWDFEDVVLSAFFWNGTPEGFEFWDEISKK